MLKTAIYFAILILLFLFSCGRPQNKTEQQEVAFWRLSFVDSSYKLLYKDSDTSRSLRYFDSALSASPGATAYLRSIRCDLLANYYYFFTKDNRSTARMIDSALSYYRSAELQEKYARTYVGLLLFGGQIAYRLNLYSKANDYYFKAKRLADAHLNPCERTAFNYNIAMVLYHQENFRQSLNYFKEAYALQQTCAPQTTAVVLQQQEIQSNIGLCYVELKNYDSAQWHFAKALDIADHYKDSLGAATMDKIYGVVYGNRVKVELALGRLEEAKQLALKAIQLNDREGYEKEYAQKVKLDLAQVYHRQNAFSAMHHVLMQVDSVTLVSNASVRMEWNRWMASYFERTSRPASAIPYLKTWFSLKDAFDAEQKRLTAADINRQLKDKEQQYQIAVLKKDKELAIVWLWVTIALSLMAMSIIYLVYQNYRKSKKSLAVSKALNKEIQNQKAAREKEARERHQLITEAVIRAQENERSIIGLELHDNINQVLTTVKLHNEMVLSGVADAATVLPRTIKYLQDCINEIRDLSKRLSAPTLGKISLEESVKDLLDSINSTSKVRISRNLQGLENQVLKKELHLGVYRILQEQLNNVLKHSDASEVQVQIEYKENRLRLCITDNGKGFAVRNTRGGIGLMNMQTRAESLNGSLQLQSEPGRGCKLEVVLPCTN
jgi:signal transduction histidine kinase